jgi:mersacidin/lichenicidin family type 2 lantibiotic
MAKLDVDVIVKAWRDADFFEGLDSSLRQEIPASPAGPVFQLKREAEACITLLNDNCNLTMVGPDGC